MSSTIQHNENETNYKQMNIKTNSTSKEIKEYSKAVPLSPSPPLLELDTNVASLHHQALIDLTQISPNPLFNRTTNLFDSYSNQTYQSNVNTSQSFTAPSSITLTESPNNDLSKSIIGKSVDVSQIFSTNASILNIDRTTSQEFENNTGSIDQEFDINYNSNSNVEAEQLRLIKEEEDSIKLAWELSQQESEEAYNIQMQYLQSNGGDLALNEDDRLLIQNLINENSLAVYHEINNSHQQRRRQSRNSNNNDGADEGDDQDNSGEGLDYDQLLELGEVIGDVKTERWRIKAPSVIRRLPVATYKRVFSTISSNIDQEKSDVDKTSSSIINADADVSICPSLKRIKVLETKCCICRDDFKNEDNVSILPCQHYFHETCTSPWVENHNSCPLCKHPITESPY